MAEIHPKRQEIIDALTAADGPLSVAELADATDMAVSYASYHSKVLLRQGSVRLVMGADEDSYELDGPR